MVRIVFIHGMQRPLAANLVSPNLVLLIECFHTIKGPLWLNLPHMDAPGQNIRAYGIWNPLESGCWWLKMDQDAAMRWELRSKCCDCHSCYGLCWTDDVVHIHLLICAKVKSKSGSKRRGGNPKPSMRISSRSHDAIPIRNRVNSGSPDLLIEGDLISLISLGTPQRS